MEITGVILIGAVVVGVTELVKRLKAGDKDGAFHIGLAVVVGALVGLLDTQIGVADITVAQGILAGFAAAGTYQVARQVG